MTCLDLTRSHQTRLLVRRQGVRDICVFYANFQFLGRGTFGVVFQAQWKKRTVAVKSVGDRNGPGIPKEVSIFIFSYIFS